MMERGPHKEYQMVAAKGQTVAEYVYLIRSGSSTQYKIGHSKNPNKRLKQLQTGHPEKLFLVHTISCTEYPARRIENFLHTRLMFHRSRPGSEWFNLTKDLVAWLTGIKSDCSLFRQAIAELV